MITESKTKRTVRVYVDWRNEAITTSLEDVEDWMTEDDEVYTFEEWLNENYTMEQCLEADADIVREEYQDYRDDAFNAYLENTISFYDLEIPY